MATKLFIINISTIIIPLYNKEKYIAKAIKSVFNQIHTQWEIIIVNDGSTYNSLLVAENLIKSRTISTLSNQHVNIIDQPNQGVSTTRNNGVNKAKYKFIAFLS